MISHFSSLALLLFFFLLLPSLSLSAAHKVGGADHEKPLWQRRLAGIREGAKWITDPLLQQTKTATPKRVRIARVGLGRTGTTSLDAALGKLGYSPLRDDHAWRVTDLFGRVYDPEDDLAWDGFAERVGERGFDAVFAYSQEYFEWAATAPDVKVILSVRDNGRAWAESYRSVAAFPVMLQQRPFSWGKGCTDMRGVYRDILGLHSGGQPENFLDLDVMERAYHDHIENIRRIIPSDRLLVFNVKQGWEPLCEFLGQAVPEGIPFPHVNDRVVVDAIMATFWVVTWMWPLLLVAAVGLPIFFLRIQLRYFGFL